MMKSFFQKAIMMVALLAFATTGASAQTMQDLHQKGKNFIDLLVDELDQEVVHVEYDLIFSEPKEVYRYLVKDYTYQIIAFTDSRVSDLDLYVYKQQGGNWVEVGKDNKTDTTPIVAISPEISGQYKFVVKVYSYSGSNDRALWGLIVAHDD